jgi:broad specificity phosphatase PhoE
MDNTLTDCIYLIRHGTPDWNRKDLPYYKIPGPPLTEQGKAEALALANFLKSAGVRLLVTSPLERTLHTAQIISQALDIPLLVDDRLMEWQPGETPADILDRARPVFEQALEDCAGLSPVGLVTHGGHVAVLLQMLGMDEKTLAAQRHFDYGNPLPPGAAWQVRRDDGKWQLDLAFIPQIQEARFLGT